MSGLVTNDAGSPIGNARLVVSPRWAPWFVTQANASGFYEATFTTTPRVGDPNVGTVYSVNWDDGYATHLQVLPPGQADIVLNLRLRRARTIDAGQSFEVEIEPDSSICTDLEDWFIPANRCESIVVRVSKTGTLTVDARAAATGGVVPVVFSATSGEYKGQQVGSGVVSLLQVQAGQQYQIFVGVPTGVAPQRYTVSTSLTQ